LKKNSIGRTHDLINHKMLKMQSYYMVGLQTLVGIRWYFVSMSYTWNLKENKMRERELYIG